MQFFIKKQRMLIAIALIGIIVSLIPVGAKIQAEETNKTYDIILDYYSLESFKDQSKMSDEEWLDLFRKFGVDKAALNESSIRSLSKATSIPVHAAQIGEVSSNYNWEMKFPQTVIDWVKNSDELSDAIVIAENKTDYDWIDSALKKRTDNLKYESCEENGAYFIYIPKQADGLAGSYYLDLSLGLWPKDVEKLKAHGFQIIPRTITVDKINGETFARAFIDVMKEYDTPYYINSGDSLLGYDTPEKGLLADYLRESKTPVGMFEENDQSQNLTWDGLTELLEDTGYHGIRIFNEWPYIQNRYQYCGYEGPEEITNSFFRAIAERNCRVIYLKMILEPDNDVKVDANESEWTYVTDPKAYQQMLEDLDNRLGAIGYTHAAVTDMDLKTPSIVFRIIEGIGVSALLIILLDLFLFMKQKNCLRLFIALSIIMTALCIAKTSSFIVILSMLGGIVMPSIAAIALCRLLADNKKSDERIGSLLFNDIKISLAAILISFCGSILASSALSQMSFAIEIDLYRGVKIMQLIPIGLFALAYLLVFAYEETGAKKAVLAAVGERGSKNRSGKFISFILETLDRPMKLSWFVAVVFIAVLGVMVLAAGVYYIYRTGNTTTVSSIELQFRNFLENLLIARPRTKEILVGWPCLMLFIWGIKRNMRYLPFLFGLAGSIGLVSVVNTFLHIRTPFLLSLLRTGWGILFGFIIGAAAVLVCEAIRRFIINHCKRG